METTIRNQIIAGSIALIIAGISELVSMYLGKSLEIFYITMLIQQGYALIIILLTNNKTNRPWIFMCLMAFAIFISII